MEAQFDCKPDNKDELAFQEGDKIAIIKVHSNDWLVKIVGTVHYLELSANFTTVYVQIFEGRKFHVSKFLTFSTILFSQMLKPSLYINQWQYLGLKFQKSIPRYL